MSDARDPSAVSTASSAGSDVAPSSPGAWLRLERERQAISTQRIAADMHLSVAAIEAIEGDRFVLLGAPVFAKGHLRKYASLLNLSADRVVELYDRLEGAPKQVDPIPLSQRAPEPALRPGIREMLSGGDNGRERTVSMGLWVAVSMVLVLGLGGAWWYVGHSPPSIVVGSRAPTNMPKKGPKNDTAASAEPRQEISASIPPVATASKPALPAALPVTALPSRPARPAGSPPPGKVRVRLSFARESWVEVYDGGGNRMLYDVGRVDLPRMIDVEPPALVVLGDAAAVTTEANDKVISVPQKNISGTVARFTIAADGSVK